MKKNCWEFKKCGREEGGSKAKELGVCPTFTETKYNGQNDSKNAGRCCWMVAGTLSGGTVQGTYAKKLKNCNQCEFYIKVKQEEGINLKYFIPLT